MKTIYHSTTELTVYERVAWYRGNPERIEGTVYAREGLSHISIYEYAGKPCVTAEYICGGRRHGLVCVRIQPFTKLGATRIVKRWMREVYRNDLVDK